MIQSTLGYLLCIKNVLPDIIINENIIHLENDKEESITWNF